MPKKRAGWIVLQPWTEEDTNVRASAFVAFENPSGTEKGLLRGEFVIDRCK